MEKGIEVKRAFGNDSGFSPSDSLCHKGLTLSRIIGKLMTEIVPEADNEYEALDLFLIRLYRRIMLKEKAGIDISEDIELYLIIQANRREIANQIFNEQKEGIKCGGL